MNRGWNGLGERGWRLDGRGISEKLMNLGGSGGSRAREKRKLKWELRRKKAEMNLGGGGRKRDNEQNRRGDK